MSMTGILATRASQTVTGAGALTAALALGATLLGAAPAQADPGRTSGTVIARHGINERQYPSTDSSVRGHLRHRAEVGLHCKVRAQNIQGNSVWYLLRDRSSWVSAKFVANNGPVRYCGDVQRDRVLPGPAAQHAQG